MGRIGKRVLNSFFFFCACEKSIPDFFGEFDIIGYREENDKVSVAIVRKYCK